MRILGSVTKRSKKVNEANPKLRACPIMNVSGITTELLIPGIRRRLRKRHQNGCQKKKKKIMILRMS